MLPSYVEKSDIEKLLEAMRSKRSHKETVNRDILLVDLAIHTGLRRSELASLKVGDIDLERQVLVVRQGKGSQDRVVPLSKSTCDKLAEDIKGQKKDKNLFGLAPTSISGKIRTFANKAGVKLHTHSLRDYFATSLSEKGATIREIQSLLGHTNLTHTERYTLHTDKHLKGAIDLIDKEREDRQNVASESLISQEQLQQQAIVVVKAVCKPSWEDTTEMLADEYHSHFVVMNEGRGPAIEIEMALLNNRQEWLDTYRETILRANESLEFGPVLHRLEGSYYILCQYKHVSSQDEDKVWAQTWLPFKLTKASKEGEVYVSPGELVFKFGISTKDKIEIFMNKPK
ncbi:tyrosine-type recombinase/integrase [Chloroflexota bacterium]